MIVVNTGLLAALSSGAISIDVMPKEIMVLECVIAGTSFRKLESVERDVISEVKLNCKREAGNEHDTYAIGLWFNDTKVG